ncbi:MAG TPA: hypothetical protein VMU34_18645, partial [Mycobacterium sp.]|nr:hypothetical protein [Mycobacterium sp.]
HAQHLGAGDFTLGLFFLAVAMLIGAFLWYVGVTVLLVGLKALFFGVVVGPAFLAGITGLTRPAAYAKHCGWQLILHALQVLVFTAYLGIAASAISWVGTTGAVAVVPRMLLLGLSAIAALMLFRFIDRSFRADGLGTLAHTVRSRWHTGVGRSEEVSERVPRLGHLLERGPDSSITPFQSRNDAVVTSGAAQFPTVSPRPDATATPAPAPTTAGSARTRTAAAAEIAATATAPEIVLPAAAVASAVHQVHSQQRESRPDRSPPAASTPDQAPQPSQAPRPLPTPDAPTPVAPPSRQVDEAPPLQFPTTPPKQRARSPEGDPS